MVSCHSWSEVLPTIQGSDGNPCAELLHHSKIVGITRFLIGKGIPVDVPSQAQETPLAVAVRTGRVDVVRFLLDAGAYPDALQFHKIENDVTIFSGNGHEKVSADSLVALFQRRQPDPIALRSEPIRSNYHQIAA